MYAFHHKIVFNIVYLNLFPCLVGESIIVAKPNELSESWIFLSVTWDHYPRQARMKNLLIIAKSNYSRSVASRIVRRPGFCSSTSEDAPSSSASVSIFCNYHLVTWSLLVDISKYFDVTSSKWITAYRIMHFIKGDDSRSRLWPGEDAPCSQWQSLSRLTWLSIMQEGKGNKEADSGEGWNNLFKLYFFATVSRLNLVLLRHVTIVSI